MNGLYSSEPALQPVIAAPGAPLHLHGYQPVTRLGGHIAHAAALQVTATVWPLDDVQPYAARREPDRLALPICGDGPCTCPGCLAGLIPSNEWRGARGG